MLEPQLLDSPLYTVISGRLARLHTFIGLCDIHERLKQRAGPTETSNI